MFNICWNLICNSIGIGYFLFKNLKINIILLTTYINLSFHGMNIIIKGKKNALNLS